MLRFLARAFQRPESGLVKVIVGLGNPGKEYERTRHNVGWWLLDHLADVWHFDAWRRDGEARVASGALESVPVRLVKPQTYMNLSGAAIRSYLRRAGWMPQRDLLIVVDEVALPLGAYRFRASGSAGGHNGLKSIEGAVGHQEYARLRIGIGPPAERERGDLADYVLGAAGKGEQTEIEALFPELRDAAALWVRSGIGPVMNQFNRSRK